nr:hypothetical protein [Candidatus Freyarchaeota archaeon]
MDIIIRAVFNNQNWMGKCTNADKDPRLYKCQEKVVDIRFPDSGAFKTDRNGNCACLWCYESTLCTEYRWVSDKSFEKANGKVFFVFPDTDNTLVLWGTSEVDHIESGRNAYWLYFKEFKPMPEENWIRGIRAKDIFGVNWGQGTYRYLDEEQTKILEKLIRKKSRRTPQKQEDSAPEPVNNTHKLKNTPVQ